MENNNYINDALLQQVASTLNVRISQELCYN